MIRLQGRYRLTFPVTPGEVRFSGYGNDLEQVTNILLNTKSRISSTRPKIISFDFWLPADPDHDLIEVEGYQGPREWLTGLDRIKGSPCLVTIEELDLAWNVLIGPCDGSFSGQRGDYKGTIELHLWYKDQVVTWSASKGLLKPPIIKTSTTSKRANTTGNTAKKNSASADLNAMTQHIEEQRNQRSKINEKLTRMEKEWG